MLQVEPPLPWVVDLACPPRTRRRLRTRLRRAERRGPHLSPDLIGALPLGGFGKELRRHLHPYWRQPATLRHDFSATSRSSGTTHSGRSPRDTRSTLSNALRVCFTRVSRLAPARCGVTTTLSSDSTGSDGDGGSEGNTSSPAPAILPLVSASCSAGKSITGPRLQLINTACGCIHPSSRVLIMLRVRRVSGTCNVTMSDVASSSSSSR